MKLKIYLSLNMKMIDSLVHMDESYLSFIPSTLEIKESNFENVIVVFSHNIFIKKTIFHDVF